MNSCFANSEIKKSKQGNYLSQDGEYRYKIGIIDFLTEYNAVKKIENTWNNMVYWKDRYDVSC